MSCCLEHCPIQSQVVRHSLIFQILCIHSPLQVILLIVCVCVCVHIHSCMCGQVYADYHTCLHVWTGAWVIVFWVLVLLAKGCACFFSAHCIHTGHPAAIPDRERSLLELSQCGCGGMGGGEGVVRLQCAYHLWVYKAASYRIRNTKAALSSILFLCRGLEVELPSESSSYAGSVLHDKMPPVCAGIGPGQHPDTPLADTGL